MPSPTTPTDLLEMVRRSGLIPADRLNTYLQTKLGQLPSDLNKIATIFVTDGLLTKFQAGQILKGRYKNFTIGRYRVLEPLGVGGMSRVYLCEHATMGHLVAMKLLPIQQNSDPSLVERFFREARAVAALNHPNVVRAHDVAEEAGKFHYLVMDYVDGVNLHDLVQRHGALSAERAAHYIAQAAEGLQHVHEAGLIHRDVKPGNLLLDRTGTVKVLDLGLARFQEPETGPSITQRYDDKAILGTADFLSPEQAIQSSDVDIRSDVYSLGATMYYLLAGRPPFPGDNVTQKLLAHQMKPPEPLANLRPDLPAGIIAVVDRMMAKKPEDRYQQPADVAVALAEWTAEPIDPPTDEEIPPRGRASSGAGSQISGRSPRSGSVTRRTGSAVTPAPLSTAASLSPTPRPQGRLPAGLLSDPKKKRQALIGGGIGAAVLAGLLTWSLWPSGEKPVVPAGGTPPADKGAVSKSPAPAIAKAPSNAPEGALVVGAGGQYTSVAAALAVARPGSRILVTGKTHEECLAITEPPANLSIEAWPANSPVSWRTPGNSPPDRPLIDLAQCKGLRIVGITFDGLDQIDDLLRVRGANPGLMLEGLQFRGASKAGVRFVGASGGPGSPARLVKSRFNASRADVAAGVAFERGAGGAGCKYVQINNCRFEGPFVAAVGVGGPVSDVDVVGNRFHRVTAALRYPRAEPAPTLQLTFAANTVADARAGLHFEAMPPADGSRVNILNNLFLKTAKLAMLDGIVPEPTEIPPFVWYDEKLPKDKLTNIPAGKRYFRKTFTLDKPAERSAILDLGCVCSFKAWVNGAPVGQSAGKYFTKRVYALDVKPHLKPGKNVISVEAENQTDPFNAYLLIAAGLGGRLTVDDRVVLTTDATWKCSKDSPDGWLAPDYPDAAWTAVKPWPNVGANYLWNGAVWDSEVTRQLSANRVPIVARGNVRDYFSGETYPVLESLRAFFKELPADPANDGTFLRYDRTSPLASAGADKDPVGCPPAE